MSTIVMRPATEADALFIARGFHTAMLYEDTPAERLQTFADVICRREDVLYSWRNTWIATLDGQDVGMVTSYDGSLYSPMRRITMQLVREHLGVTFENMQDEAQPGEYYIDSLAVLPQYRGRGIGRQLLQLAIRQGLQAGLCVTLAVDPANPRAQALYRSLGFSDAGTLFIFGHDYLKMQIPPSAGSQSIG